MMKKVAILGAQGYGGRELARLILGHPQLILAGVFTTKADWDLSHDLPEREAKNVPHFASADLLQCCDDFDIFLLATPADVSITLAKGLWDSGKVVIDLSGAFRLPKDHFESWYGMEHSASEIIDNAIYGLSPWNAIPQKNDGPLLIANAGCFASCALMALLPLLKDEIISSDGIIIDAKSGASGAGRAAKSSLQYCELSDNFYPYKIGKHQHTPEIEQCITSVCPSLDKVKLHLTTSLLPIKRGIAMALYCPLNQSERLPSQTLQLIQDSYQKHYGDYPLARFLPLENADANEHSFAVSALLSLKHVVGSARVHIVFHVDGGRCLIFASIDNLMKGAASGAIENVNRLLNIPVDTGLSSWEGTL